MNVVAHNILAGNTQRQFGINTKNKTKSAEKLSSGYRINRAADDAAGLSISEKLRKQIRGLTKGVENTQQGVSLCQVADGALAEVHDMLHRITELSVQSANCTNTDEDRQKIQKEINHILQEIDRVGDSTTFNEHLLFKEENTADTANVQPFSVMALTLADVEDASNEDFIRDSISVTGSSVSFARGTYTIGATTQGITIDGTTIAWNQIQDAGGNPFDKDAIAAKGYSFTYSGVTFKFETAAGSTLNDVINAIDGTEFMINSRNISTNVATISSISITPGTQTNDLLQGSPITAGKTLYIEADDEGIAIKKYSSYPAYTKWTWSQMGIDDWSSSGAKNFTFSDPVTGVTYNGKFKDGTTKTEAIDAMNAINFKWDYIDRDTSTNSSLILNGISVPSDGGSITNKLSEVQLSDMWFSQYGGVNDLYAKMGYTTPSEIVNGINISLSLVKNSAGELALKITSPNGSEDIMALNNSKTDEMSQNGYTLSVFGGFDNSKEIYNLLTPGISGTSDKKAFLENYVGQEIATVKLPSPYTYSIEPNKVSRPQLYVGSFTTNGGGNVSPGPNPTPDPIPDPNPGPTPPTDPDNPGQNVDTNGKLRLWIQSGSVEDDGMYLEIDHMNTSVLGIRDLDVSTVNGANHAMTAVQEAVKRVSENRSKIGAQQNRLEHTISNEKNIIENTAAAESLIRDTDMADEMVRYSNSSILEQIGQAMMAQANQSNQGVLQLLS